MIDFHFESDLVLEDISKFSDWVSRIIEDENLVVGKLDYVFCYDDKLLAINQEYLGHDTYTDIITFDYTDGRVISGDIFISTDRVRENAKLFLVDEQEELLRVMSHGILHLAGYEDKSEEEIAVMRAKEEEKIKMFHVEQ
ncbi:rRNA maturation RNase YbeY [Flagellimonas meridianipacifica]|uniref:Endoribonuclease YbeY n=1 Tax=Flagellimonas meridianipacifica TaxID=1080225 RepID=A0A2T0MH59_9FLAO|nr:rRNA maturation RNase YbeY [Allomuricauda pacifica]PRX56910.1 rRNA maturation RNase YbeY [Allomuricauda pacifica]